MGQKTFNATNYQTTYAPQAGYMAAGKSSGGKMHTATMTFAPLSVPGSIQSAVSYTHLGFGLQSAAGNTLQDQSVASITVRFMTQNRVVVMVKINNDVFEVGKAAKLYSFEDACYLALDSEIYEE